MAADPLGNIELIHGFEPPEKRKKPVVPILFAVLIIAALAYLAYLLLGGKGFWEPNPRRVSSDTGYYTFNETTYYKQGGSWYEYDDGMGWIIAAPTDEFLDNYDNYFEGNLYSREFGGKSFAESDYYKPEQNGYGEGKAGENGQVSGSSPAPENDYDEDYDW